MADVRWIKIYTDMISNKKIKRIRKLPEGNNIVLIWVFLLAQAGECNKSGALYLTDAIAFRPEDLAIEFDFDVSVINLALITLERFSMIEVFDEIIYIKNWNEYQNIEGMDKIREQTRLRNIKYREKRKQLLLSDVSVTSHDETEVDLELEKEKDTTTTADAYTKTIIDVHTDVFGTFNMTGHMTKFVTDLLKLGYTEIFIQELMLEAGESSRGVPSMNYLKSISDRWIKEGIYTRAESKRRHDEERKKVVSIQTKQQPVAAPKEFIPDADLMARVRAANGDV
ncbi:phage replisome organizer N-terminal domain-containing protein [Paenibacillus sp. HWE-109]|uniref:phage replisome organizer N-terminal domain-containing protein n=1 Tax=Paenibacillus sp. HWE-109 TaxID=1306526 RepID=UPI001EDE5E74|nr:phage replisome organizer N-terminal domain-containing protein [Paenibacillus sp. HWE-109]UKS25042.1 phage replisome organizer N-terminal domain-containing protein [Paenibacillus sp. HWE-109]